MNGRESIVYISLDRELKDASSEISEIFLNIFDGAKIKFSSSTQFTTHIPYGCWKESGIPKSHILVATA